MKRVRLGLAELLLGRGTRNDHATDGINQHQARLCFDHGRQRCRAEDVGDNVFNPQAVVGSTQPVVRLRADGGGRMQALKIATNGGARRSLFDLASRRSDATG